MVKKAVGKHIHTHKDLTLLQIADIFDDEGKTR